MKKMTVMLLVAIMLAAIGFTGCPNGNGNEDPTFTLSQIRITGIPFYMDLATAGNSPAFMLINPQGVANNAGVALGGFAILNAGEEFPGLGVPEMTPNFTAGSSVAVSPLYVGVLELATGLLGGAPAPLPTPETATVSGSSIITVNWLTIANQLLPQGEMIGQLFQNTRTWTNVAFSGIDSAGVLTLDWAAGQ